MWNLGTAAIEELRKLPETGIGFQLVESRIMGGATRSSSLIPNARSTPHK